MEKETKILLGLAAAGVVAYLVLKPKIEPITTSTTTTTTTKPINMGTYDKPKPNDLKDVFKFYQTCGDGYRTNNPSVDCIGRGGYNTGVLGPILKKQ